MNQQLGGLAERKRAKQFCAVAVLAVLIATLKPFNPFPKNGVTWLQGTKGLRFKDAGLVKSNEPLRVVQTQGTESYSLELLLQPANTKSVSTILAFDTPSPSRELFVQQWKDALIVTQGVGIEHDRTGTMAVGFAHAFRPGRLVFVIISSGPYGTSIFLDGQPAQSSPYFKISHSDISGKIVLGTSLTEYQPWSGELYAFSVYAKELTSADALRHYKEWSNPSASPDLEGAIARYSFAEAGGREVRNEVGSGPTLEITPRFMIPHKSLLRSPAKELKENRTYANDVFVNIAGFVPLGLIGCAYLSWTRTRWKAILFTTVACGVLSFVIEVLQYYIPQRGSGMTDIITNTLGAALGALLLDHATVRRTLEKMNLIRPAQPQCAVARQTARSSIKLPSESFPDPMPNSGEEDQTHLRVN